MCISGIIFKDLDEDLSYFLFKLILKKCNRSCCSISTILLVRFWIGLGLNGASITAAFSSECTFNNNSKFTLYILDVCKSRGNLSDVPRNMTIDINPKPIEMTYEAMLSIMALFLMVTVVYSCKCFCCCLKCEDGKKAKKCRFVLMLIYKLIVIGADIFVIAMLTIVWIYKGMEGALNIALFTWNIVSLIVASYQLFRLKQRGLNSAALSDET
ncbi:unnamed protein product [Mytilus coruscus]|uniref:Uncharacterized protein n=1 Tax=Mytilus coruscus TaxID=42192 RepID=A0A6J8EII9_MYTCO|nr:unnamed protein product [Mytilus coruscus]